MQEHAAAATPEDLGPPPCRFIVGMRVDAMTYPAAVARVMAWARRGESRSICVGTVHMVMEAHDDPAFQQVVNGADLVTSDGMPLVWGLRRLGLPEASRVYGPDLTPLVCEAAAAEGIPVGFYGGSQEALDRLVAWLCERYPSLKVAYTHSPPFRPLSADEGRAVEEAITASGARIVFVGLGCPKQEQWMAARRGRVPCVMLGVGAAFDLLTGHVRQAPQWMMAAGLEWLFRLMVEPKRLWYRYLYHNPRFVALFARQLLRRERG
jgi:N-acetylglucosaminyldiphosphoundecaprenol N-acetyl-beta-D-mannosaminyltransferase